MDPYTLKKIIHLKNCLLSFLFKSKDNIAFLKGASCKENLLLGATVDPIQKCYVVHGIKQECIKIPRAPLPSPPAPTLCKNGGKH